MTFTQPNKTIHRRIAAMLVVVLLLAQSLGWMHRIWHDHASPQQEVPSVHREASSGATGKAGSWVATLFQHEAGEADCWLFDAAVQPGCAGAAHLPAPAPIATSQLAITHGEFVARWAALFDARGPPRSR